VALRLRAPEREDLPIFVTWFNDPEVRQYLSMFAPMSLAQEERWFEGLRDRTDDFHLVIEIQQKGTWRPIGNCGLHNWDKRNRKVTVGIAIGEKDCWSHGQGTAALKLLLAFAFDELNVHRVELNVYDFNARARRCYEKVGFRLEGVRRQAVFTSGRYLDVHDMAILEDEYRAGVLSRS
ncbi:MAG: GNAT family N-acetyltransferase, partial [Armatimonadetes bacterium]|nr:GNAT family N-acetyltransferase [Armatimonadota bacterium]